MNRILISGLITAAAACVTHPAIAADTIRLCTGSSTGNYFAAGEMIQRMAGNTIAIEVVETGGTIDNMERMLSVAADDPKACDAMIGQPDGPVYLARKSAADAKRIRQIASLHREYLHILCNKDSGVDDLGDLENSPEKYRLAVGEEGSGGWLIWQNLIAEDDDYAPVPLSNEGGDLALSSVSTGDATCMLVPAGLKNGTVNEADTTYGDNLVLVGANDRNFDDTLDIKGKPLYQYAKIPGSTYPNSFNYWSDVQTLSWNAGVYVNIDRFKDKKRFSTFTTVVNRAATGIKAEFGK